MKIQTLSGKFDIFQPDPTDIHIGDIARSLAMTCRFGGHVNRFYSVAQHCALVSSAVPEELRMHALLHDAAEAYIGDIRSPIKWCAALVDMERDDAHAIAYWELQILNAIYDALGLKPTTPEERDIIGRADDRALLTEARLLLPNMDESLSWPDADPLPCDIEPWPAFAAEREFLMLYETYGGEVE